MPFPIEKDIIAVMESNGVQAKWSTRSGNPGASDPKLQAPVTTCVLVDTVSGEEVVKVEGSGRVDTLKAATDVLRKSPRVAAKDQVSSLQSELAALKAKLAEVRDTPAGKNTK